MFSARPVTVHFTDEASYLRDLTGGKGSSLGELTRLSSYMKSVSTEAILVFQFFVKFQKNAMKLISPFHRTKYK